MTEPQQSAIVTRFAPSPTGLLHGGNYRTAVFSYLFARQHHGKFILRIEDTDRERSKKEYEANILESLEWLGLEYDAMFRQSDLVNKHTAALQALIDGGHAYVSKEAAKDGSGQIRELVRFKNPNKKVEFTDLIRGQIAIDTTDLGDFVIAKSVTEPLFHIAVVVDDASMGITHVIRGEDHIANTPRQILIYEALGYPVPAYAHLPLVLDETRAKLSKRRGAQPLTYYRDQGYLPDAILNFLSLLGWNPGTDQEIFTREELIAQFSLERIQKGSGIFNPEKLNWVNKEHLKRLTLEEQRSAIARMIPDEIKALPQWDEEMLKRITPIIMERIVKLSDVTQMIADGEIQYFFSAPTYPKEKLFWKGENDPKRLCDIYRSIIALIQDLPDADFTSESLKNALWSYAEGEGRGSVLWPMRYALSGKDRSPDPFQLAAVLGKRETISRLTTAIALHHVE